MFVKPPPSGLPLVNSALFPLLAASVMPMAGGEGFSMGGVGPSTPANPSGEDLSHSARRHASMAEFVSLIPERQFESVCEMLRSVPGGKGRHVEALVRLEKLPYELIGLHPELMDHVHDVIDAVDGLRGERGFEGVDRRTHSVRLIDAARFDEAVEPVSDTGVRYGIVNGDTAYVRFDEREYRDEPFGAPMLMSVIAHELVHPGLPGISEFSHYLNEGIVEKIARDIFASRVRPRLYPDFEAVRAKMGERIGDFNAEAIEKLSEYSVGYGMGVLDGRIFDVDDVIAYTDRTAFVPPYYQEQVAFVRFIERDAPAVYDALVLAALEGASDVAHNILARRFGTKLADLLARKNPDWSEILTRQAWE